MNRPAVSSRSYDGGTESRGAAVAGGIAMILFALFVVVFVLGRADIRNDPLQRSEASQYLEEIEDGKVETRIAFGAGIAIDTLIILVIAASAYSLFRDRSHWLAALSACAFVANAALSGAADALGIALTFVAEDYVRGGVSDMARDPSVLETGRTLGILLVMLTQVQVTAFSLGALSLGLLLARAPRGRFNPPRIIGWVALIVGAAGYLSWLVFVADVFSAFLLINTVGTLIAFPALGGWLIWRRPAASSA